MGTTINLSKGQTINLSKESNGAEEIEFRAKWNTSLSQTPMDVDIMAVELKNGECHDILFYGAKDPLTGIIRTKDEALTLSGDDRTGGSKEWNETIKMKSSKIDKAVNKIACILSIDEAIKKGQNFGLVRDLHVEIYDVNNNNVIATFTPDLENPLATAMVLGEIIINNNQLFFKPISQEGEIINILKEYKIEASY